MAELTASKDRLIVKRHEAQTTTEGGILLAESAIERPNTGVVLLAGKNIEDINVGATVYFSKYAGNEIKFGEQMLTILKEDDVIAFVPAD